MTRDRIHVLVPLFVGPLLFIPLIGSWLAPQTSHQPLVWVGFGAVVFAFVTLAIATIMAPRAVRLTEDELVIDRFWWPSKHLPLSSLTKVEAGPPAKRFIRLFGVGGWFWSGGLFWSRGVGRVWAWITRLGPTVLVHRKHGIPILLGADDAAGLLTALGTAIGSSAA